MAATLTKKQAADAVAAARDEREIMQANLLDVDGSFGRRLLAGATLTGITKQRWESAAADLAALWDLYEAYSAVIDRAAETLARRPGQKGLAEITALLTGPSVEIDRGPAPLARRNLVDTGREQMTLTTARARMSSAFAWVTGVVSAAEQAWNDMAGALDSAAADLSGIEVLGDQDLALEMAEVQADLDRLRGLLNTDPLGGQANPAAADRLLHRTAAVAHDPPILHGRGTAPGSGSPRSPQPQMQHVPRTKTPPRRACAPPRRSPPCRRSPSVARTCPPESPLLTCFWPRAGGPGSHPSWT